eukprot:UN08138
MILPVEGSTLSKVYSSPSSFVNSVILYQTFYLIKRYFIIK